MSKDFKNRLFVCSITDFLMSCFFPNVQALFASDNAGESLLKSIFQCLLYPFLVPFLRNKVRKEKEIEGNVCQDVALGLLCPCCVVIQLKTEFE